MHALGEGFRQTIGERLAQDRGVVVIGVLEAVGDDVLADPRGDHEGADVIRYAACCGRDEIRQRRVEAALALFQLLAQRVEGGDLLRAAVVGIDGDVIADSIGRPEADRRLRLEPVFLDDEVEHLAGVGIERARHLADLLVVENRRKTPGQFPGLEEWRPVDVVGQFGEVVIPERPDAEKSRPLRRRFCKVDADRVGAGGAEFQPLLVGLGAEMRRGDLGVFGAHLGGIGLAPVGRQQRGGDADGAAGVVDVDRLAARVFGVDGAPVRRRESSSRRARA